FVGFHFVGCSFLGVRSGVIESFGGPKYATEGGTWPRLSCAGILSEVSPEATRNCGFQKKIAYSDRWYCYATTPICRGALEGTVGAVLFISERQNVQNLN